MSDVQDAPALDPIPYWHHTATPESIKVPTEADKGLHSFVV